MDLLVRMCSGIVYLLNPIACTCTTYEYVRRYTHVGILRSLPHFSSGLHFSTLTYLIKDTCT